MAAMFALVVEEIQRDSELDVLTATERAHESLLPKNEREAIHNRRMFAGLLANARRSSKA